MPPPYRPQLALALPFGNPELTNFWYQAGSAAVPWHTRGSGFPHHLNYRAGHPFTPFQTVCAGFPSQKLGQGKESC